MPTSKCLIADIGGTNIRLAWFDGDPRNRQGEETFRTDPKTGKPYEILPTLKAYAAKVNQQFTAACLGMAGKVQDNQVQITNRPDLVRGRDVAAALNIDASRVLLVNDMPPHLASVDLLLPTELIEIQAGKTERNGNRAILIPGTGVGTGGAVGVPGKPYLPFASEGGHVDFAPRDEQQYQLMQYLRPLAAAHGQNLIGNEFVFAGEGLRRIFGFVTGSANLDAVPKSEDITTAAGAGNLPASDPRQQTVELYLKIVAAAAGNLALMFAATGGLYLGGSICLSLRKFLNTPLFLDPLVNSGPPTHRSMMQNIPVRLIDYTDSGLLGTGALALGLVGSGD